MTYLDRFENWWTKQLNSEHTLLNIELLGRNTAADIYVLYLFI